MKRGCGVLVVVVLAAGCGSGRERIDERAAERLARQADAVAASLARGDGCAADRQVRALRGHARAAIARDEIPERLRPPLLASLASLRGRIVCSPPAVAPPPPPPPDENEHDGDEGNGKGKGHGKGHGKSKR